MKFKRIVSRSSSGSSSSSRKDQSQTDEIAKLIDEIDNLNLTVESMKISLESKDVAIDTINREKEELYVELKSAQRTNRQLHQQLNDERDIHAKEKGFLIEEIKRITKDEHYDFYSLKRSAENERSVPILFSDDVEKNEIIFNLCAKYFRIRSSKTKLLNKYEKLLQKNHQVYESIVSLLEENKECLDNLLQSLIESSVITPSRKKYLTLLKLNAKLQYENTELKIIIITQDYTRNKREGYKDLPEKVNISESECKSPKKARQRRPSHHNVYLYKSHSPLHLNRFGSIHSAFSPYPQNICRTNSDPCLFQLTNK